VPASDGDVVATIVSIWSDVNPVAGYTSGHLTELTATAPSSAEEIEKLRVWIRAALSEVDELGETALRETAAAILTSLQTQLALARPSGAGPSGTGMGGVYSAADGIFYILLKKDAAKAWVGAYLEAVAATVAGETERWAGRDFTVLERRECLDTAAYMAGTVAAISGLRPDLGAQCRQILAALSDYAALFEVPNLDAKEFTTYWSVFQAWDEVRGPTQANGYPGCLIGYYQLQQRVEEIETMALAWLDLDLPVVVGISEQVQTLPGIGGGGTLQNVWDRVSAKYAVDFDPQLMAKMIKATDEYGATYIVGHDSGDVVDFAPTPDYLVDLVTGGEDFAVNYLNPAAAYSQLYLTAEKNTSLLTMINILVHEASHGYNFVLSAKNTALSPLLNVNTALEVPTTEGMAFWREYEYWAAAQALVGRSDLEPVEEAYLQLYGATAAEQSAAILCAQLETYIWRIVRYVRALCDVRVNGGKETYTDFIAWAAGVTGLSEETLHGECFTFMASPGYAPCYSVGGVTYAAAQARARSAGVSELIFNTTASAMGFYAWPAAQGKLEAIDSLAAAP
jgi:hypothetical protein